MKKIITHYDDAYLLSLSDWELVDLCKHPPTDLEFTELKIASDILADRYNYLLKEYENLAAAGFVKQGKGVVL